MMEKLPGAGHVCAGQTRLVPHVQDLRVRPCCLQHAKNIMFEDLFSLSGLSLERLKSFADIVSAGGMSAAAADDSNRQSQFSRQLKELERYFGVELIKRGRGPMKLTPAGQQLYQVINHTFGSLQEFRHQCASRPIELNVGAGESLIQWMLLPRLSSLLARQPEIALSFQNLRSEDIFEQLSDGTLDFGVVTHPVQDKRLESVLLGRLEYALFVPSGMRADKGKNSELGLLQNIPLALLIGGNAVRQALEKLAQDQEFKLNVRLRLSSYPQLVAAVQYLKVAAVMPTLAAASLPAGQIQMVRLPLLDGLSRRISLVWNRKFCEVRPSIAPCAKLIAKCFRAAI